MSTKLTSVAIVNSTVDGTPIGGTTKAQGLFTDLEAATLEVSGTATAPTPASPADNSTNVATTAWVQGLFARSLSGNGYTYLPGGLLLQWGSVSMGGGGDNPVTFPTPFPTACFQVLACTVDPVSGGGGDRITYVVGGTVTTTGCTLSNNGSGASAAWLALGH